MYSLSRFRCGVLILCAVLCTNSTCLSFELIPPESPVEYSLDGQVPLSGPASGSTVCQDDTEATPEIVALARALRHDPKRIYEYVRNRIEYVPTYGLINGAHGCLIAGRGNDWDQASLLTALLRTSGFTTRYRTAAVIFSLSDVAEYGGVEPSSVTNIFTGSTSGGGTIPGYPDLYVLPRIWVEVLVDSVWRQMDPAYKSYAVYERPSWTDLTGFDETAFMTLVTGGSVTDDHSIRNVNVAEMADELTDYSTNVVSYVQNSMPEATASLLINGRGLLDESVESFPEDYPSSWPPLPLPGYPFANAPQESWNHIQPEDMHRVRYAHTNDSVNDIAVTLETYRIAGRRVSLCYDSTDSGRPKLYLDGTVLATGNPAVSGGDYHLNIVTDHAYFRPHHADSTNLFTLHGGGKYLLVSNHGSASERLVSERGQLLNLAMESGAANDSEEVLCGGMHVVALSGLVQWDMSRNLYGMVAGVRSYTHHFVGIFGQESGYLVDIPGVLVHGASIEDNDDDVELWFTTYALVASGLEHSVLEQAQGRDKPAASTVKVLDINNAEGYRTFLADSTTVWNDTVADALIGYPQGIMDSIATGLADGHVYLLPENGDTAVLEWEGHAYVDYHKTESDFSIGMPISGGYEGAYGGLLGLFDVNTSQNLVFEATYTFPTVSIPIVVGGDPVNLQTGHLVASKPLLSLGSTPPRGLVLTVGYNSGQAVTSGVMGNGWTHSLDMSVSETTHAAIMLGSRRASEMGPLISAAHAAVELLRDSPGVAEWTTAALVTKWAMDQLSVNSVLVKLGDRTLEYVAMPNGTYSPPAGVTTELVKDEGFFRLVERFGKEYLFDSDGRVSSIIDADDNSLDFLYDASGQLETVRDTYGRTFTFSYYDDGKVSDVIESAGSLSRTVGFSYTDADLTTVTDPDGHPWTYEYDGAHQIVAMIDPLGLVTSSNVYNDVGQVVTQFNGYVEEWAYYCSGYEGTEVDPKGGEITHFFDSQGRDLGVRDALGHRSHKYYDGQGNLVSNVNMRGYATVYQYDPHHNLTNRIDAAGNHWRFEYDEQHHLRAEVDPLSNTNRYFYDDNHHLTNTVDALTNEVVRTYYPSGVHKGLLHTLTDANTNLTVYTYDTYGNASEITRDDGGTVVNSWSPRGDLLVSWDANDNPTTRTYNSRRLLTSTRDALGNTVTNLYNDAGLETNRVFLPLSQETKTTYTPTYKISSVTYSDGSVVSNRYDERDWIVGVVDRRGSVSSNVYDAAGRRIAVIDRRTNRTDYAFDENGSVTAQTNALLKVTGYQYDKRDQLVKTTTPLDHSVSNTYDAAGRLVAVTDELDYVTEFRLDGAGRKLMEIRPNGVVERFNYDGNGNLTLYYSAHRN